jgi:Tat protein secretion system quality control protein TatD with DNase activity
MFFDTHAHLTYDALYHDLPAILHRAKEHKVDVTLYPKHFKSWYLPKYQFLKLFGYILHCFTGMLEEAREVVNRGWLISFSGIVTRELVEQVPVDHLLLKTDALYLVPQGRGETQRAGLYRGDGAPHCRAKRDVSR